MADDKLTQWLTKKIFGKEDLKNPVSKDDTKSVHTSSSRPMQPQRGGAQGPQRAQYQQRGAPQQQRGYSPRPAVAAQPHGQRAQAPQSNAARAQAAQSPRTPQQQAPRTTALVQTGVRPAAHNTVTRVMPLGGLDEVGKNCMLFENDRDILMVDLGFQFPDEEMLGIDYIIPDVSYLDDKKERLRGILLTHGHLDHIGAIPYLIERLGFPPIYGTKLTLGILERKLEEFGLTKRCKLVRITADDTFRFGSWNVSFFRVNHSIPDAVGIVLRSPHGTFVHTGDFKFDLTPSGDQKPAEFDKIAGLGRQNVTALFSDSTNAMKVGHTTSELEIAHNLEDIISKTEGRIIIASFSSLIGRIQQIMDYALKYRRKVYITGRSMLETFEVAKVLGYLKYPKDLVNDIARMGKIPDRDALILTTGAQGEDVSALSRISLKTHQLVRIKKGDTVVISATPIIGNERAVTKVINNLCRLGAKVIHSKIMDVHTSGHANQEDLKLMITLVKPKYMVPVHGEYFMRQAHNELANIVGVAKQNGIMIENGDVIEFRNGEARVTGEKVPTNYVLVDGLGRGDVGAQVILDRQSMSENGVLVVLLSIDGKSKKLLRDPDIISRGFIYMSESDEIMNKVAKEAKDILVKTLSRHPDIKRGELKNDLRVGLEKFTHRLIERRPLILPVIAEL